MSIGVVHVVGSAFTQGGRNILPVLGIFFIFGAAAAMVSALWMIVSGTSLIDLMMNQSGILLFIAPILTQLLFLCASLGAISITTRAAAGDPIPFGEAMADGVQRSPAGLLLAIIQGMIVSVVSVGPLLIVMNAFDLGSLFALPSLPTTNDGIAAQFLSISPMTLTIAGAFTASAIASFLTAATMVPLFPVLMYEDAGIRSLPRALELTKGYRTSIAGSMFMIAAFASMALLLCHVATLATVAFTAAAVMKNTLSPSFMMVAIGTVTMIYVAVGAYIVSLFFSFPAVVYTRLTEFE